MILFAAYVIPENQESQSPGNIKERKIQGIQIDNPTDTGGIAETSGDSFSDEITGILEIEGWPAKHIQAKRKKKVHLPDVEEDIVGSCPRKEKMTAPVGLHFIIYIYNTKTKVAFYIRGSEKARKHIPISMLKTCLKVQRPLTIHN